MDNKVQGVIPVSRCREIAMILVLPELPTFTLAKKEDVGSTVKQYTSRDLGAAMFALLSFVDSVIARSTMQVTCPVCGVMHEHASGCLLERWSNE